MLKMQPTQGVSFPRSGHSAIYEIALRYFGESFVYCDVNNPRKCGCGSVPCVNPGRMFSKNHDFGLLANRNVQNYTDRYTLKDFWKFKGRPKFSGVPIIPHERYFIQYRTPVRAIASNFRLHLRKNPDRDNRAGWERFARMDVIYWNRFVDKWVLNFPRKARSPLYCTYESLTAEPEQRVREILSFMSESPLNENRVRELLQRFPIADKDSISRFEYYDPVFFGELQAMTSGRIEKLGLPLL